MFLKYWWSCVAHLVADNDSDIEQISSETESISEEEIYLELNYIEKKTENQLEEVYVQHEVLSS